MLESLDVMRRSSWHLQSKLLVVRLDLARVKNRRLLQFVSAIGRLICDSLRHLDDLNGYLRQCFRFRATISPHRLDTRCTTSMRVTVNR